MICVGKNIKVFNFRVFIVLVVGLFCLNIRAFDDTENNNLYLFRAAKRGNLDWVKKLVEDKGADVNYATSSGKTVLIKAASKKQKKVVKYLLELKDKGGAQDKSKTQDASKTQSKSNKKLVNFDAVDNNGNTAMHKAAKNGDTEIVKMLIAAGANTNKQNRYGDTPMHLAVKNEDLGAFKELVASGADFDIKNNKGNTVLHFAAKGNFKTAAEILVNNGANLNTKNKNGRRPIDDAKYGTKELLVQYYK